MLAQRFFVQIDRFAPTLLRLKAAAAFDDVGRRLLVGLAHRRDDADLRPGGRGQVPQQSGDNHATEPQSLTFH